ncbi:GTP-binding protein [Pelomyxa schiedti]|nr:GTP-binding protein [Pelomyxa schiedti]
MKLHQEITRVSALLPKETKIEVVGQSITEIPERVSILRGLTTLYLHMNQISEIPRSLCSLTSLRDLNLSHNKIRQIPQEASQLVSLERIWLAGNIIQELPEGMSTLTSLQKLWLSGNKLSTIPPWISCFKSLSLLQLHNNCVNHIPLCISALTNLKSLRLKGEEYYGDGLTVYGNSLPQPLQNARTLHDLYAALSVPSPGFRSNLLTHSAATVSPSSGDHLPSATPSPQGPCFYDCPRPPPTCCNDLTSARITSMAEEISTMQEKIHQLEELLIKKEEEKRQLEGKFIQLQQRAHYEQEMQQRKFIDNSLCLPLFLGSSLFAFCAPGRMESSIHADDGHTPLPGSSYQIDYYSLFGKEYIGKLPVFCPAEIYREILGSNLYRAMGIKAAKATLTRDTQSCPKSLQQPTRDTPMTICDPSHPSKPLPIEGLWRLAAVAKWLGDVDFLGRCGSNCGYKVVLRNSGDGGVMCVASIRKIDAGYTGGDFTGVNPESSRFLTKHIIFGVDIRHSIPFSSLQPEERKEFLDQVREIIATPEEKVSQLVKNACPVGANTPPELLEAKAQEDERAIQSLLKKQNELSTIFNDVL